MFGTYRIYERVRGILAKLAPVGIIVLVGGVLALSVPAPAAQDRRAVAPLSGADHRLMINEAALAAPPKPAHSATVSDVTRSRTAARAVVTPTLVAELNAYVARPTPTDVTVVRLIHRAFPARAWSDAVSVAWCESKFRPRDIDFDSNGTHDRGIFQLNDGGTEQYLLARLGRNPRDVDLAFNPVLNVRAAAILYARDGWSQWTCQPAVAS